MPDDITPGTGDDKVSDSVEPQGEPSAGSDGNSRWTEGELDAWYDKSGYGAELDDIDDGRLPELEHSFGKMWEKATWKNYTVEQKAALRQRLEDAGRFIATDGIDANENGEQDPPSTPDSGWGDDHYEVDVTLPDGEKARVRVRIWPVVTSLFGAGLLVILILVIANSQSGSDDIVEVPQAESPAEQAEQAEQPDQAEPAEQPDQAEPAEQPNQAEPAEQPDQAEPAEQAEQPEPAATSTTTVAPAPTTTPVAAVTVDDLIDATMGLVAVESGHLKSNGSSVDVVDGAPAMEIATSVFQDGDGRVYYVVEGPRELVELSSWEFDALAGGQIVSETSLIGTSPQPAPPWVYDTPNGSLLSHDEFPIDVDSEVVIEVICTDTVIGDGSETSSNWFYFPAGDGEHDFVHFSVDLASVPTIPDDVKDAVLPSTETSDTPGATWLIELGELIRQMG